MARKYVLQHQYPNGHAHRKCVMSEDNRYFVSHTCAQNFVAFNYIDDKIMIHKRHSAQAEFDVALSLFEFLGIPVNPKKVVPPSRVLTCIGICIDIDKQQLTIPQSKIIEIVDVCRQFVNRKYVFKNNCKACSGSYYLCIDACSLHVCL